MVLILMFFVIVLNIADRHIINILTQDIKIDLSLCATQLALPGV